MNAFEQAVMQLVDCVPAWAMWAVALTLLISVPLNMCKWLCCTGGRSRRREWPKTMEKGKDHSTAPIPCDIHDDCTDCGFCGTGYCWNVMKHE